jgi:hypothetical protein
MDSHLVAMSLTRIAHQLVQGLDELLHAISLLEDLPPARSEAEWGVRVRVEGMLNRLHVRLARAELAAQHALPPEGQLTWPP